MAAKHAINPNQLRMFMTGPEIQAMYGPNPAEREWVGEGIGESDEAVWKRKLEEATRSGGYETTGGMRAQVVRRTLRASINKSGVQQPVEIWHDPPGGQGSHLAEGHHRTAVAAADIPEQYVGLEHYDEHTNWMA